MTNEAGISFNSPFNGLVLPDHAISLKELGFVWETRGYYYYDKRKKNMSLRLCNGKFNYNNPANTHQLDRCYSAPSIYEATEWLRKEKGIYVESIMRSPTRFEAVGKVFVDDACPQVKYLFDLWDVDAGIFFPSYEIGLLYGIGHALLRLKKQKNELD